MHLLRTVAIFSSCKCLVPFQTFSTHSHPYPVVLMSCHYSSYRSMLSMHFADNRLLCVNGIRRSVVPPERTRGDQKTYGFCHLSLNQVVKHKIARRSSSRNHHHSLLAAWDWNPSNTSNKSTAPPKHLCKKPKKKSMKPNGVAYDVH
jgi:hypothetical protein